MPDCFWARVRSQHEEPGTRTVSGFVKVKKKRAENIKCEKTILPNCPNPKSWLQRVNTKHTHWNNLLLWAATFLCLSVSRHLATFGHLLSCSLQPPRLFWAIVLRVWSSSQLQLPSDGISYPANVWSSSQSPALFISLNFAVTATSLLIQNPNKSSCPDSVRHMPGPHRKNSGMVRVRAFMCGMRVGPGHPQTRIRPGLLPTLPDPITEIKGPTHKNIDYLFFDLGWVRSYLSKGWVGFFQVCIVFSLSP